MENNDVDYINLRQKRRKKALDLFIYKSNRNYTTIADVKRDLDLVQVLTKQSFASDTIKI
ncbi:MULTISPECIES: hypothetical protein [Clostridium]|uniref:Uncharacterized protein n=1 Tax=Clostridium frigoriphilum TaxID=443253 RepID=A0ABU7UKT4_9CLOT|nr:hypothetical protein [Clostridium sp. DSM 17811]MBU3097681.1 hypothetical protein [Clostridium sp. DSM 17811]